jgi:cellulose synthase/poly-beta-1,6-N-acetylglucosamine synthase-like glycosyltransferase
MPGKNIMVSATEAQPVAAAVAATRAKVADFEIELGERESRRTQWPKISLVTAVHNGAKYLEATIRSAVEQGYPNLEYIVVDDGRDGGDYSEV